MSSSVIKSAFITLVIGVTILGSPSALFGQGTAFTYQGRLQDGGTLANGNYDFQFTLWDALSGGTQQPQPAAVTVIRSGVPVANGVFTTQLDFGANAFPGTDRYLEIGVRLAGGGAFTILSPRQQITPTPYALRSLSAAAAESVPVNAIPAGSANYIQNTTSPQSSSNFNISGTGTADIVNANTQFNLGGTRILTRPGFHNLSAGENAGQPGGCCNSFFGWSSGFNNSSGANNAFFGHEAGAGNTTGSNNTFIGASTGNPLTTQVNNSTAVGANALVTQSNSVVLGSINGTNGATADTNVGIGTTAPAQRLHVVGNSLFTGTLTVNNNLTAANVDTSSINWGGHRILFASASGTNLGLGANTGIPSSASGNTNSTAIGANAFVDTAHTIVLGTAAETTRVPGILSVGQNLDTRAQINVLSASGNANLYLQAAGVTKGINFGVNSATPNATLFIAQYDGTTYQDRLVINPDGSIMVGVLGSAGSTQLCRNDAYQLATCSSSLRYKTRIKPFAGGLNVIRQLRPITFNWKTDGKPDVGLGAEEVATVDPLFVTRNTEGEIEGVKYDRLSAVFINAFKEQQAQIEQLQEQIKRQQTQINRQEEQAREQRAALAAQQHQLKSLKKLVCRSHARAARCR